MASILYRHRIYCTTSDGWAYKWTEDEAPLASCPDDPAHEVNPDSESIESTLDSKVVVVTKEPAKATGGHIRIDSVTFVLAPGATEVIEKSWPFPISVYSVRFGLESAGVGCVYTVDVGPRTPVGALVADVEAGATVLAVSPSVAANAAVGYIITLAAGASVGEGGSLVLGEGPVQELGRVVAVNAALGTITAELPAASTFLAAAPTLVLIGERPCDGLEFGAAGITALGDDRPSTLSLPAGTRIVNRVTNPNANPCRIVGYVHYSY